jgi:hypothetical protein
MGPPPRPPWVQSHRLCSCHVLIRRGHTNLVSALRGERRRRRAAGDTVPTDLPGHHSQVWVLEDGASNKREILQLKFPESVVPYFL